ncbi:MAG: helix-turn-helix domain-containing protein, partial [Acidimicrobiia bacterium]
EYALACEDAGLYEEALPVLEAAGARRAVDRIEHALRRRPSSARPPAVTGWDSLTPTELKVAHLAAEGLTNRQIGERLFISRRTVETHLASVYTKLGVNSRAQLARKLADLAL